MLLLSGGGERGRFSFLFWSGFVWFWLSPLEHHLLLHCLWGGFSHFFPHSYLSVAAQCFYPFLSMLLQRHHQCLVVSPLEPAGASCVWQGASPSFSSQTPPCRPLLPVPGHLCLLQKFNLLDVYTRTVTTY